MLINLEQILESLVRKNYLKMVHGKYKPGLDNFYFEVYKFLDPHKIAVISVAREGNKWGVYHQGRVRGITPREAARLQGFPNNFILHPKTDNAYYHRGNSVSINGLEAVAPDVFLIYGLK